MTLVGAIFCDECSKALNPNDDDIYYGSGAYCLEHHPKHVRDEEVQELVSLAKRLGLSSEDLDDEVFDLKSAEASEINNAGMFSQLAYMWENMPKERIIEVIQEAHRWIREQLNREA